jgi:hypothetical protein
MWRCKECDSSFDFPEIKRPDAGMISGEGILGLRKVEPVRFCPECLSTKIDFAECEQMIEK